MQVNQFNVAIILKNRKERNLLEKCFKNAGMKIHQTYYDSARAFCNDDRGLMSGIIVVDLNAPEIFESDVLPLLHSSCESKRNRILYVATKFDSTLIGALSFIDIKNTVFRPLTVSKVARHMMCLLNAAEFSSNFSEAYNRVRETFDKGDLEEAHHMAVTLAERFHPQDITFLLIGDIEMRRGYHLSARRHFNRALLLNSHSVKAKLGLVNSYLADGNISAAMAEAEKVCDATLGDAMSFALSFRRAGVRDLANKFAEFVVSGDPGNQTAAEVVAESYCYENDVKKAYRALIATHTPTEMLGFLNEIVINFAREGFYQQARCIDDFCSCYFRYDTRLYQMHYNLALITHKRKDLATTRDYLYKSLELRPDFKKAKEMLNRLTNACGDDAAA